MIKTEELYTDILIIGGGTAGCYAAITLAGLDPSLHILILEKANIRRSGCLAAGVNALNAYITKGHTPDDYVDYAVKDAHGIAREDLLLSMSEHLNEVTSHLEQLGLVILKDENGEYVTRGARNIKINGENIKPILAEAVMACPQIKVINRMNVIDLIKQDGIIKGAYGNSIEEEKLLIVNAKKTLVATGGAAGIYKPNHPGFSRHKMWYCPFNTGAGYAMGIRAGAEMTTFEMRFIALRCKDTIAPTGTLAQGVGAKQINARGDVYEDLYGLTTSQRVWGTVAEQKAGRGPCYLQTKGITLLQEEDLEHAYLNMAPSQTLKWVAAGRGPSKENVEIEGTEPYITGGHTGSGYWVDNGRRTTLPGLYAAGDVAGGCPQKYVTGALAEGKLAAEAMLSDLQEDGFPEKPDCNPTGLPVSAVLEISGTIAGHLDGTLHESAKDTPEILEKRMQDVMDRYAGGIVSGYAYTEQSLKRADEELTALEKELPGIFCSDMQELTHFFEVRERLTVARVLIAHLLARKETRWHCFAENASHPERDDANYLNYVNSRYENGTIIMIRRPLAKRRGKNEQEPVA